LKVGIIADTHIRKKLGVINKILDNYLNDVDVIIHVGDFSSVDVLKILKSKKRFFGVYGNNDGKSIKSILNRKEIIHLQGYNIGLIHGDGDKKINIEDRVYNEFKNDNVDIIIFGHSHQPLIKTRRSVLMINPGSLTRKYKEKRYSYVILDIAKGSIKSEIKFICKK